MDIRCADISLENDTALNLKKAGHYCLVAVLESGRGTFDATTKPEYFSFAADASQTLLAMGS